MRRREGAFQGKNTFLLLSWGEFEMLALCAKATSNAMSPAERTPVAIQLCLRTRKELWE